MTEHDAMDPFERRLGDLSRVYADAAITRPIDPLDLARGAMAASHRTGWWTARPGAGLPTRRIAPAHWAAAFAAVVVVAVVALAIQPRPSEPGIVLPSIPAPSGNGPIPDALRHAWERPYAVTPGLDPWGSGLMSIADGALELRHDAGAAASTSAIAASGPHTIVATATAGTAGCSTGDEGAYSWIVEGSGTVLTLTAVNVDACPTRKEALAGMWVRSDLPPSGGGGAPLEPGTYETARFAPFGDPAVSGQLSYTVPEGWTVLDDQPTALALDYVGDAIKGQPSGTLTLFVFADPRVAAEIVDGAPCGGPKEATGVGGGRDELVAAITARDGVASGPPEDVTIGGFAGRMLDLKLATGWTGNCLGPGGPLVGMPLLYPRGSEPGPVVGLTGDHPVRLVLVGLPGDRTVAIAIGCVTGPVSFDEQVALAMPIVESFEFHAPKP